MNVGIQEKLRELEGETFYTKKGIPFTYQFISESTIHISKRRPHNISITDFEKAIEINPQKPSEITNVVHGSSYVFGIITDNRFK